eukprot:1252009-Karenia_brevis.AAC.1
MAQAQFLLAFLCGETRYDGGSSHRMHQKNTVSAAYLRLPPTGSAVKQGTSGTGAVPIGCVLL